MLHNIICVIFVVFLLLNVYEDYDMIVVFLRNIVVVFVFDIRKGNCMLI